MLPKLQFVPRRSDERGHADHGWLKTFHTFSFAMYHDGAHTQFGPLRVLNEDRVATGTGFGKHPHREYEIFSYVVSGQLEHKDSLGNTEVLKRGHLQLTSTGTGILHSEKTHGKEPVHFLQIWSAPAQRGLQPKYYTRWFGDAAKRAGWVRVVAPAWEEGADLRRDGVREGSSGKEELGGEVEGEALDTPAPVQSALSLYATMLAAPGSTSSTSADATVETTEPATQSSSREIALTGSKAYVHLIQTSGYNPGEASGATIRLTEVGQHAGSGVELREGDGAYIQVRGDGTKLRVENVGGEGLEAEVLVFDLE